jgi:hypothetical protein
VGNLLTFCDGQFFFQMKNGRLRGVLFRRKAVWCGVEVNCEQKMVVVHNLGGRLYQN